MSGGEEQRLWADPASWRGPRWFPVYFCERDARLMVPKPVPAMGWTLNFAHSASWWALWGLMTVPSLIAMMIIWAVVRPPSYQAFPLILLVMLPPVAVIALCRWALGRRRPDAR